MSRTPWLRSLSSRLRQPRPAPTFRRRPPRLEALEERDLPAPIITTSAGAGSAGYSGDGGPATSALLNRPSGMAVDASGNVFVADTFNHRVRKVTPQGTVSTYAGSGIAGYNGDTRAAT